MCEHKAAGTESKNVDVQKSTRIFPKTETNMDSCTSTISETEGATAVSNGNIATSIVPSVPNLRDMGGHVTRDGRRVRTGILYRSEQLDRIADSDVPAFEAIGLRTIVDFRTEDERTARPERIPAGVEYVVEDVLADLPSAGPAQLLQLLKDPEKAHDALDGNKVIEMFSGAYASMVSLPSALHGYSDMFARLAVPECLPALFHCTTGKDRTGWAAAALLTLCGVSMGVSTMDLEVLWSILELGTLAVVAALAVQLTANESRNTQLRPLPVVSPLALPPVSRGKYRWHPSQS